METAKKRSRFEAFETTGTLVRIEGPVLVVRTEEGELRGRRAVSCLVLPVLGDYVLSAVDRHGDVYILAILQREDRKVALSTEGDLELRAPEGRVSIAARDGVDLVSGGAVAIASRTFSLRSRLGSIVLKQLSYVGDIVRAEVSTARLEAGVVERFVDRVSETVKRSFRKVEELDQVKAKRIDYGAEQSLALHSENVVVAAKELVKVDGSQIHMG